jgi:4-amino-4-deoxy-L-arabinose transferase-like glycosyltransferase
MDATSAAGAIPGPTLAARPGTGLLARRAPLVALALFAASLALSVTLAGEQGIWFDEAVTLKNGQQPFDLARNLASDATPPLYPLLVHLWLRLVGVSLEGARLLSALASAASTALLFLLGRRFLGAWAGLAAALLFASSRFQIFFAHEARPYALVVLLCIASFDVLLAMREAPTRGRIARLALIDAALLYTHYVAVFALLAQGLAALATVRRGRRVLAAVAASQALALLLLLPLAAYLATLWPLPMAGWLATPTPRAFWVELGKLAGSETLAALEIGLLAGGVAWIARARGSRAGATSFDGEKALVLALWAFAPLVAAYAASFVEPVFLARYLLYAAPGLFLLLGYVATSLPATALTRALVVGALCVLSALDAARFPIVRPPWREAAERVRSDRDAGALVAVVPAYELLPFAYHFAPERFAEPQTLPAGMARLGVSALPALDEVPRLAASGRPLVVVGSDVPPARAASLAATLEAAGYEPAGSEELGRLVLLRFARRRVESP